MTDTNREVHNKEAEPEKDVERTKAQRVFNPAVDIIEQKEYIILLADMP